MAKKTKKVAKKAKKEQKLTAIQANRVAIAKDALAQLKIKAYDAVSSNGYVCLYDENSLSAAAESCELFTGKTADKTEFNKFMDNFISPSKPCTICAKGAIFLSAVKKFNNFSLQRAVDEDLNDIASSEVQKIFGMQNADKIEEYFECQDEYNDEGDKWSDKYDDDNERLEAILKNIIANKGDFIPVM